jgi:hypothetical protein
MKFILSCLLILAVIGCKQKTAQEKAKEQVDKIIKDMEKENADKRRITGSLLRIINSGN